MEIIKIDVNDEKYPRRLRKIKNFPIEIYAVGNIDLLNSKRTVAIVGSRKCTEYGRLVTTNFAKELADKEICIISGMAIGIDGIAHDAAIKKVGRTIAVLGSGLNKIFPPENEWLFHKIIENSGCIVSEYPPNTEADKKNFPIRNIIISGLADSVLVVEAVYRSGSSITAKYAVAQGKKIFAIPSNIYSSAGIGTNKLIQEGAILVTSPDQILKEMNWNNKKIVRRNQSKNLMNQMEEKSIVDNEENVRMNKYNKENLKENDEIQTMPEEYLQIYRELSSEEIHINEIAGKLNKTIQDINPIITMLEIEGYVEQPQINYFKRKDEKIDIN